MAAMAMIRTNKAISNAAPRLGLGSVAGLTLARGCVAGFDLDLPATQQIALALLRRLHFLLPRRYRPVSSAAIARAMVLAAQEALPGFRILESDKLQA